MGRKETRQAFREIKSTINRAKAAMYKWIVDLGYEPTNVEIKAWQAGYLAGLNHKEDNHS